METPEPFREWTAVDYVAGKSSDMSSTACPKCGYEMIPVQLRFIDRLLSILNPVHRFRCTKFLCGYERNLKELSAQGLDVTKSTPTY